MNSIVLLITFNWKELKLQSMEGKKAFTTRESVFQEMFHTLKLME